MGQVPKLPEKYEDWTPPWDGEEIDPDKAGRLLFNALTNVEKSKAAKAALDTELTEAKAKLSDAESKLSEKPGEEAAKDKEISDLRTKVQKLESDGRESDTDRIARLEIALEKGLTERQAARLVGKTREELEEDADVLREELGLTDENNGGDPPPPSTDPRRLDGAGGRPPGNGRSRSGDQQPVKSIEDLRKESHAGNGLTLAPLTR